MKISSLVTNGFFEKEVYQKLIARMKADGADQVHVICLSQEYYAGLPVGEAIDSRKRKLMAAGADEVILISKITDILDEDSRIYAVSTYFLKQKEIHELVLPMAGDLSMVSKISDFLMRIPASYQDQVKELKKKGKVGIDHDPHIMDSYVPGAEEFLSYANNFWSMKLYQNIRNFYSPVKVKLVNFELPQIEEPMISAEDDQRLFEGIKEQIDKDEVSLVNNHITDLMYGTQARTKALLAGIEKLHSKGEPSFAQLATIIEETGFAPEKARCFLLMVLHNFRKIDNTVLCLRGYL